jgi:diguanylate cyclase
MEKTTEGRRPVAPPSFATTVAPRPAGDVAKAALRRLASQRLEPTPGNYARAWKEEGGEDLAEPLPGPAKAVVQQLSSRLAPAGSTRDAVSAGLAEALVSQRWEAIHRLLDTELPTSAQQAQAWAALIERLVRQLERHQKQWTPARKKENLQHVLSSARGDVGRLQQRLGQMLAHWESAAVEDSGSDAPRATGSSAGEAAEAPETGVVAAPIPAWSAISNALHETVQTALVTAEPRASEVGLRLGKLAGRWGDEGAGDALAGEVRSACLDVARVLQHRHVLVEQLGALVHELTDSLGDLSDDDGWVRGQCQAMRHQIGQGLTTRGVRAVTDLLGSTRRRQAQVRVERAEARDSLKQLIHQMLQDLSELGEHTGRFSGNVGRYAEVIGQADSLEGLAGVVREMVEETRTVHALVSQTTDRLREEHRKATAMSERVRSLEAELSRLSDEVSTDQLTQVANRRGLIRDFDTERALAAREGSTLAVGILDLDNFKRLNDSFGHQTGDEALKFLARRVGELVRPGDRLARYGGEEFVVLLPGTGTEESLQVLTRIQRQLSVELFMHEGKQTFVTFSAGVTTYREGETLEAALQRADEALYEAKRTGKNRTCAA